MPISVSDVAALAAAVVLAAIGGEIFLKGILGAAIWLRVPPLLVATTLAAFATSSPELTVSSIAALSGKPEIGLGDALGSNVVNIALVFGIALMFGPIRAKRASLGRDFALALAVPALTLWLAFDGVITRVEGALLLASFAIWMVVVIRAGAAQRVAGDLIDGPPRPLRTALFMFGGLAALLAAGRLFVLGASGIAGAFGIDVYVIGATVVAIGTSLPELVTVLLARWRGHDDIGVGTLLGSNLFNGLAIVGTAASIHPIRVPFVEVAVTLGVGMLALMLLVPDRSGHVSRARGGVLLACYAAFVVATTMIGSAAVVAGSP
jgi:cation:H+ antiporter